MARDYTKFTMNNNANPLTKRALAFEMVKTYSANCKLNFQKIKEIFPDDIQGAKGFIRTASELYDPTRFHTEVLISKDNVQYLVSNQWGSKNINRLLNKAKSLGIIVKEYNDANSIIQKTTLFTRYKEDGNFGIDRKEDGYKTVSDYDKKGNLIESFHYKRKGIFWHKRVYKYNSKNVLTEIIEYNSDDTVNYKLKYDSFGNYYREDDKVDFDTKGLLQKRIIYYSSGEEMYTSKYDYKNEFCEIREYYPSGNLKRYEKIDKERKPLEVKEWETEYDGLWTVKGMKLIRHYTYEYEYDSMNNWIKSTCYKNNSIYFVEERIIEYV